MPDMLAPSSDLLRAGFGLKINQIKRATRSYLRDRTDHVTGTVTSYAVAVGLFAASGIFLIAACLVGAIALFRWVEITYGRFEAFGVVGGLLLVIAIICALLAAGRLRRPSPHFPSLGSRLRVAITANPVKSGQIEDARTLINKAQINRGRIKTPVAAKPPASSSLSSSPLSSASLPRTSRLTADPAPELNKTGLRAGLVLTASLLGWAAARQIRMRWAPRTEA
jgi:hypothetical protein